MLLTPLVPYFLLDICKTKCLHNCYISENKPISWQTGKFGINSRLFACHSILLIYCQLLHQKMYSLKCVGLFEVTNVFRYETKFNIGMHQNNMCLIYTRRWSRYAGFLIAPADAFGLHPRILFSNSNLKNLKNIKKKKRKKSEKF